MKTRKKIILATSALVLFIVAGAIAVISVLAAQNVTVQSQITVNYIAKDVWADVILEYSNDGSTWTAHDNLSINPLVAGDPATYTFDTMTTAATYVRFGFKRSKHNSHEPDPKYKITGLTIPTTITNYTLEYSKNNTSYSATKFSFTTSVEITDFNSYTYFYVKMYPSDICQNATISGSFTWSLESVPKTT